MTRFLLIALATMACSKHEASATPPLPTTDAATAPPAPHLVLGTVEQLSGRVPGDDSTPGASTTAAFMHQGLVLHEDHVLVANGSTLGVEDAEARARDLAFLTSADGVASTGRELVWRDGKSAFWVRRVGATRRIGSLASDAQFVACNGLAWTWSPLSKRATRISLADGASTRLPVNNVVTMRCFGDDAFVAKADGSVVRVDSSLGVHVLRPAHGEVRSAALFADASGLVGSTGNGAFQCVADRCTLFAAPIPATAELGASADAVCWTESDGVACVARDGAGEVVRAASQTSAQQPATGIVVRKEDVTWSYLGFEGGVFRAPLRVVAR
ncbi:MAG: hypothetical protein HOO96_35525 [Polyangiaceae bacterium]|nr:hypothetical protein [Polyangiaceae bacterium]